MTKKIILITGAPGVGKTWLMKELIELFDISKIYSYKTGMYQYLKQHGVIILGKYDDTMFEGSDRLSMAVMSDNEKMRAVFDSVDLVVGEGDRFTNSSFIRDFDPFIIKIKGTGEEGRIKRGSSQSDRQIKSITTRVNNLGADLEVENSSECFEFIKKTFYGK